MQYYENTSCTSLNVYLQPCPARKYIIQSHNKMSFWCSCMTVKNCFDDVPKNWILGPKSEFLPLKREILGSLGQKKPCWGAKRSLASNPKLPRDSWGYGDNILMLEKSVRVQKMELYGCSVDIFWFFGPKMGLKPAQGRPVQCFQHKKSLFTSF